jgi:hypothetical protein
MKSILIFILVVLLTATISAQSYEFSVQLASGLYSFRGSAAASTSTIVFNDNYTISPWGRRSSFSYVFGMQVQRITISNYLIGFQTSYESLSSKVKVDNGEIIHHSTYIITDGKTILTSKFISFHPFLGKRIKLINSITSDLTIGTDLGVFLNNKEHETGKIDNGVNYNYSFTHTEIPSADIRIRIDFINYYKKIGLTIGYSLGLTNYRNAMESGYGSAYSCMIRFGLTYRLKK